MDSTINALLIKVVCRITIVDFQKIQIELQLREAYVSFSVTWREMLIRNPFSEMDQVSDTLYL